MPKTETIATCPLCGRASSSKLGEFSYQDTRLAAVRCNECILVYVNPCRSAGDLEGYFQTFTKTDRSELARWYKNKLPNLDWDIRHLQRLVPLGVLLDVGCGHGFLARVAQEQGYIVQGVEISKPLASLVSQELGISVFPGAVQEASFPEGAFDVVTCMDVLYYCPAPLIDLREMYRMLRPGGVIAVRVLTRIGYARAWQRITRSSTWDGNPFFEKDHILHFSVGTMCRMLAAAGYEILRVYPSHLTYWKRYPAGVQVVRKLSDWGFQTLWRLSGERVGRKPTHARETGRA